MSENLFDINMQGLVKGQKFFVFSHILTDDNIFITNPLAVVKSEQEAKNVCKEAIKRNPYIDVFYKQMGVWYSFVPENCKKVFDDEKQQEYYDNVDRMTKEKLAREKKQSEELQDFWDSTKEREQDLVHNIVKCSEANERKLNEIKKCDGVVDNFDYYMSKTFMKIKEKLKEYRKELHQETIGHLLKKTDTNVRYSNIHECGCVIVCAPKYEIDLVEEYKIEHEFSFVEDK